MNCLVIGRIPFRPLRCQDRLIYISGGGDDFAVSRGIDTFSANDGNVSASAISDKEDTEDESEAALKLIDKGFTEFVTDPPKRIKTERRRSSRELKADSKKKDLGSQLRDASTSRSKIKLETETARLSFDREKPYLAK